MNYLELAQALIEETGLAGGEPDDLTTVIGQTGELRLAVRWIRDACLHVDNLWHDWKYLWQLHEVEAIDDGLADGSRLPTLPSAFTARRWDRDAFYLNHGTASPIRLRFEDWSVFRHRANTVQTGQPSVITVRPDGVLIVDVLADEPYAFRGEAYKRPTLLAADDDEPDMPSDFHRIIVAAAKMKYADQYDAPEVLEGAEAEYTDLREKLESDQLDAFSADRMAGQDLDLAVDGAGYGGGLGSSYPTR